MPARRVRSSFDVVFGSGRFVGGMATGGPLSSSKLLRGAKNDALGACQRGRSELPQRSEFPTPLPQEVQASAAEAGLSSGDRVRWPTRPPSKLRVFG